MTSFHLDLAGSEVRALTTDADGLRVEFAAAQVTRDGTRGFVPGASLRLAAARVEGDPAACFGRIADGELRVDGRAARPLAVPSTHAGAVRLSLRFANGAVLAVDAASAAFALAPDAAARFVEDFSC